MKMRRGYITTESEYPGLASAKEEPVAKKPAWVGTCQALTQSTRQPCRRDEEWTERATPATFRLREGLRLCTVHRRIMLQSHKGPLELQPEEGHDDAVS